MANPSLAKGDVGFGVDYITNKIVTEGLYWLYDSQNRLIAKGISFDAFGNITGWPGINFYEVLNDFTVYEEDNVDDAIFLSGIKGGREKRGFTFRIENNTLFIEELKSGKRQLTYRLVSER